MISRRDLRPSECTRQKGCRCPGVASIVLQHRDNVREGPVCWNAGSCSSLQPASAPMALQHPGRPTRRSPMLWGTAPGIAQGVPFMGTTIGVSSASSLAAPTGKKNQKLKMKVSDLGDCVVIKWKRFFQKNTAKKWSSQKAFLCTAHIRAWLARPGSHPYSLEWHLRSFSWLSLPSSPLSFTVLLCNHSCLWSSISFSV